MTHAYRLAKANRTASFFFVFADPNRKWLNDQNERMRQGPVNESSLYNYVIVITAEAGYDGMSRKAGTDVFVIYKYIKNRYSPQYTIIQQMTLFMYKINSANFQV